MRYDDEIAYKLVRQQQEIALSRSSGDPAIQAIHREMAHRYGSLARGEAIEQPVPIVAMQIRI